MNPQVEAVNDKLEAQTEWWTGGELLQKVTADAVSKEQLKSSTAVARVFFLWKLIPSLLQTQDFWILVSELEEKRAANDNATLIQEAS